MRSLSVVVFSRKLIELNATSEEVRARRCERGGASEREFYYGQSGKGRV
jgi:hypothetical protein